MDLVEKGFAIEVEVLSKFLKLKIKLLNIQLNTQEELMPRVKK